MPNLIFILNETLNCLKLVCFTFPYSEYTLPLSISYKVSILFTGKLIWVFIPEILHITFLATKVLISSPAWKLPCVQTDLCIHSGDFAYYHPREFSFSFQSWSYKFHRSQVLEWRPNCQIILLSLYILLEFQA